MFKPILRAVGLLLLGFTAFMLGSMVYAAMKKREAAPQDPRADEVDLVANFEPLEFHSESGAFRGGSVTTMFGGGELDLRNATLAPGGATIRINALFGGGNLVVPDGWNVESKLVGIGGVGDGRPKVERTADAPTLRLEGTAIFGGWGISSSPSGEFEQAMAARATAQAKVEDVAGTVRAKVDEAKAKVEEATTAASDAVEGATTA